MTQAASQQRSREGLTLVPLDCPTCGAAVMAAGEDVVFYCTACRNGYRYLPEEPHLERVDVQFIAASNVSAERYLPFWAIEADVAIKNRRAGRQLPEMIQGLFGGADRRSSGPSQEFVVPAFRADLNSLVDLTRRYTQELPRLDERLGEKLTGGCYGVEDAKKVAHFALIATEVDKPDTLRALDYTISFGAARLLGVPFARDGKSWKDAVFGIRVLDLVS